MGRRVLILTTDEALIRSIIEDETVIDGFSDGDRIEDLGNAVYFYEEGVGLFPARIKNSVVSIHAAIPKKNRGVKAVKAARSLANDLKGSGYTVTVQVRYNNKQGRAFVNMVGFSHIGSNEQYQLYRYM